MQRISARNVRNAAGRSFWKILSVGKYSFDILRQRRDAAEERTEACMRDIFPLTSDGRISKLHCVIIHKNDKLYVKDEDSRNGTYLNGVRIDRPMEIQRDDIIGVGETRLEVQRILRESD